MKDQSLSRRFDRPKLALLRPLADHSTMVLRLPFILALFAAAISSSPAQIDTRGGQIELELVSEVRSIQPGRPFQVGLSIRHAPGWHTYWKKPGIVGVPTHLIWDLPEGFTASEIQWPPPQRVKMTVLTAYGYPSDTLLLVTITPPASLKPGESVSLHAQGSWMTCSTTCHPGYGSFTLRLPVRLADEPNLDPDWHPHFESTRHSLPRDLPGWSASIRKLVPNRLALRLESHNGETVAPQTELYFYAFDDQVHSDKPQVLSRIAPGVLELQLESTPFAPARPETFSGLIFNAAGWKDLGEARHARLVVPWLHED